MYPVSNIMEEIILEGINLEPSEEEALQRLADSPLRKEIEKWKNASNHSNSSSS